MKISFPLFKLLTEDNEIFSNIPCKNDFETLKEKLYVALILRGPNWSLPFHIYTYASDTTLGVVLGRKENQLCYAIYFVSKNTTLPELNYTVIEKEFLVVVHVINKSRKYIIG
jgi:hypothetical protein